MSTRLFLIASLALASGALGCGGTTPGNEHDSGHGGGMDTGMPEMPDAFHVGPQDVGAGNDGGCVPGVEICGDHIDEDCDGHEVSCGDHDMDTFNACSPQDTDLTQCDCNDNDRNTYPAHNGLPGGPEVCDMHDNDCDGRIDESAQCCTACQALGDTHRGDLCGADGSCQCSTNAGNAPCGAGQICCSAGCTDPTTDSANCSACGFACTNQTDRCVNSLCICGAPPGMICQFNDVCTNGTCMPHP